MSKKFVLFTILLIASIFFLNDVSAVSAECTDSDGRDYSVVGTLVYNGKSYTDRCYENDARYVLEYYCDASNVGKSEWKLCSGGCVSGVCQGTTTTNCTPNWQAGAWSTCTSGRQTRSYTDSNNCGVTTGKPANETQNCNNSSVLVNIYGNGYNGANGPLLIKDGSNKITISWNSTGADYCIASDSLGYSFYDNKETSGSESINIPTTGGSYTYTIKCYTYTSSGTFTQANLTVNVLTPKVTLTVTGPKSVVEGGSTTIAWTTENIANCRLTGHGVGINDSSPKTVSFNFNPHVYYATQINYSITCMGFNGEEVTAHDAVEVLPMGAPTVDIKANGSDEAITVKKGQPLTLTWTSSMMSNCEIYGDQSYTGLDASGSQVIDTNNNSGNVIYYRINCRGDSWQTASDVVSIDFSSENYSTVNLKINNSDGPINLPLYSSLADISWTTFGQVSSCTASCTKDNTWSGLKSNSGGTGKVGNFSSLGEYNYVISCATPVGNISDSVLVNISSTTVDLKVDNSNGPITIVSGNRVQLSWTTNQANSCTASGDTSWTGQKSASGGPIYSDYIFSTKTFSLTCKDALNKAVTDSVVVNVSSINCVPNWQPGSWSICLDNRQTRTYTDSNNCGVTIDKPADEFQSCSCTDSDNGKNYFVKGTMTYNGLSYTDTCSNVIPGTLGEYSCGSNGTPNQTEFKVCENGCSNGACGSVCTPNWQASVWSTCTNGKQTRTYTDSNNCGVTTGKPANETQNCTVSTTCTDSDNGKDNSALGVLSYNGATYTDKCDSRYPTYVLEYYCDATGAGKSEWGSCPNGCLDGVCKSATVTPSCTSSWQTSAWTVCDPITKKQTKTYSDANSCSPATSIKPQDEIRDCAVLTPCTSNWQPLAWTGCDNGIKYRSYTDENNCAVPSSIRPNNETQACTSITPSCTSNWQASSAWSVCVNGSQIRTYTDANNCTPPSSPKPQNLTRACTTSISCTDSDNGRDYSVLGILSYNGATYKDKCDSKYPTYVLEYYCDATGAGKSEWGSCPNGCLDGVCKASSNCVPNWQPGDWSTCINDTQIRKFTDSNNCGTATGKPADEAQWCSEDGGGKLDCIPSLQFWSATECSNGWKTEIYLDINRCDTTSGLGNQRTYTLACDQTDTDNNDNGFCISSWQWSGKCVNRIEIAVDSNNCPKTGSSIITPSRYCQDNCSPNWKLSAWSACIGGKQTRTYTDFSNCGVTTGKPADETQSCTVSATCTDSDNGKDYFIKGSVSYRGSTYTDYCYGGEYTENVIEYYCASDGTDKSEVKFCANRCLNGACMAEINCNPNWKAGAWSTCTSGKQTRTYTDSNNCGTTTGKPANETQNCTVSTTCTDSDNGRDYSVLGILSYNGATYKDKCDSKYPTYVLEYYCDATGAGKSEWGSCPNGCLDGVCKASSNCVPNWQPTEWSACSNALQTRTYRDTNNCGVTTGKPVDGSQNCIETNCWTCGNWGECINSIQERVCSNNCGPGAVQKETRDCQSLCTPNWQAGAWSTCTNGKQTRTYTDIKYCGVETGKPADETQNCTVSATCTDSDNGKDFTIKGIVNYKGVIYTDKCDSKYPGYVLEYYCDASDAGKSEWGSCPGGCLDGICKGSTSVCTPKWEIDPLSGCINGKKLVIYVDKNNCGVLTGKPTNEGTIIDCTVECVSDWQLQDYWSDCVNGSQSRGYIDFNRCGTNKGKPVDEYQPCAVNCYPSWQRTDWSACTNGKQTRTYTDIKYCGVETGKPADETQSCTVSATCTDSDNGKDFTIKGIVNYKGVIYTDKCDSKYPTYVLEYYCDASGVGKSEWGSCPNGCLDGVCKASSNCVPNWQAGEWSTCEFGTSGRQIRSYIDLNKCNVTTNKPADEVKDCNNQQSCSTNINCQDRYQNCYYTCSDNQCVQTNTLIALKPFPDCSPVSSCNPNWKAGVWSTCTNGKQTRTYTDSNNCNITTGKPADETQNCTVSATCTDSDNGKDFTIKGIVNYKGVIYTDKCDSKYPGYVLEYYCDASGAGKSEWGSCPNGCLDGVCKGSSSSNFVCVDESSGISYDMKDLATSLGQTITQVTTETCNTLFSLIKIFR